MLYYVFAGVYVVACMFLLIVVLLQQGKGGDIAAAFGGSSSQQAFGARAGATVLTRATSILGALFLVGALALNILGGTAIGGSVVGGIKAAPVTTTAPALPVPTTPTPAPATTPTTPIKPAGTPIKKDDGVKKNAPATAPAPVKKGGGL